MPDCVKTDWTLELAPVSAAWDLECQPPQGSVTEAVRKPITTEGGDPLVTEGGDTLVTEDSA